MRVQWGIDRRTVLQEVALPCSLLSKVSATRKGNVGTSCSAFSAVRETSSVFSFLHRLKTLEVFRRWNFSCCQVRPWREAKFFFPQTVHLLLAETLQRQATTGVKTVESSEVIGRNRGWVRTRLDPTLWNVAELSNCRATVGKRKKRRQIHNWSCSLSHPEQLLEMQMILACSADGSHDVVPVGC